VERSRPLRQPGPPDGIPELHAEAARQVSVARDDVHRARRGGFKFLFEVLPQFGE
jgi:hypothetical protein